MQGSSLVPKFDTGNMYTSLDCEEEAEDVGEGDGVGMDKDEAMEEAEGAHVGSGVGNGVETDETTEERSTASHGFARRGVEMIRTAVWTVVSGVGGVIGRIATAPFGHVETADKTCPVRKKIRT